MEKKSCLLTTYVSGEKYQSFIPMLVFSCNKAYPEYDIMIFLHEELNKDIKSSLEKSNLLDKVIFKESVFKKELPNISPLQSKSCRWILWDDSFLSYKYLYFVDIDMFYIREPQPLHVQHSERMEKTGLPFDNMRRFAFLKKNAVSIMYRVKQCGFKNFFHFLFDKNVCEEKLSGLHFVNVKEYYTEKNLKLLDEVKTRLFNTFYFPEILTCNNEVLLANIVKRMGYDLSVLGVQTDSITSLSFENIFRKEFRPHHGFHLGLFRDGIYSSSKPNVILDSATYHYYLECYVELIKEDDFKILYDNLPAFAKTFIDRLHFYYKLPLVNNNTDLSHA